MKQDTEDTINLSAHQDTLNTNVIYKGATGLPDGVLTPGPASSSDYAIPYDSTLMVSDKKRKSLSYFYPFDFYSFLVAYVSSGNDWSKYTNSQYYGNGFYNNPEVNIIKPTYQDVEPGSWATDIVKNSTPKINITGSAAVFGSTNTGIIANLFTYSGNSINDQMYTINNLFMSTLNYANNLGTGDVTYNNQKLYNSFIISNQASSDGKKKIKGALKLNLDSMPIVIQKNSDQVITQLDQTNVNAINWPSWINILNNNNNRFDHKIINVFYNSGNGNDASKASYYVYTSYEDNIGKIYYQMYYFGVNEGVMEQAMNKGVGTGNYNPFYSTQNIQMDPLTRRLYLLGDTNT